MIGILSYKVLSLQNQVDTLKSNSFTTDAGTLSDDTDISKNDNDTPILINTNNGIDDSNLAGLSDTLKVYLTFDDGPSANTENILKVLDDYGIKATFFVQGRFGASSKDLIKRIYDEGHTIGIHTYTHAYDKIYQSLDSFVSDISNMQDMIFEATGEKTKYYRFPGGSSNAVSDDNKMKEFINYLDEQDMIYIDWNVASGDAASPSPDSDTLVENVMKDVVKYKSSIVLLHDSEDKNNTVKALPILIERLREAGAVILPISENTTYIQHVKLNN